MMSENKELVRSFLEAWGRHDLDLAASLVTEDFLNNSSTSQGREGIREEGEYWFTAFPDATVSIEDLIAEGDKVVARLIGSGSHQGQFMGMAPTGRRFSMQEIDVYRVENGLIAEVWAVPDVFGLMSQLGLLPQTGGSE